MEQKILEIYDALKPYTLILVRTSIIILHLKSRG